MQLNKQVVRGAIVTRYGSQCVASRELGIHERRLSRLLNGHDQLRPEEAKLLREKLGVSILNAHPDSAKTAPTTRESQPPSAA